MATNLALDPRLLENAHHMGGYRTKRETVNQALAEFISRRNQRRILDLEGKIDFRPDWNYKRDRRGRGNRR